MSPLSPPQGPVSACSVQTVLLEGSVVRDCLRLSLSILLILLSLPLLAISFLVAALCVAPAVIFPRLLRRRQSGAIDLNKLRAVDEFGFEGALDAYEELISAHAWRKR